MKDINTYTFKLKLIKDLGMKPIGGFRSDNGKPRTARFVLIECNCGNQFETRLDNATTIESCKSCACSKANLKHGDSRTKLYNLWQKIHHRCNVTQENTQIYKSYRHINVCKEWDTYEVFKNWAESTGYQEGLEIDRINNDKDYSPSNCRWTNRKVQGRNTRQLFSHNKSGYRGVCYDINRKKWKAYIKVNNKKIELGRFTTKLDAAKAYDTYVVLNNLEHTINGVLHEPLQSSGPSSA